MARRSREEWRALVVRWRRSGQTKRSFARSAGVNANTLGWCRMSQKMRRFLADGGTPIHNSLSELLLRQPFVGRENWLFAGSEGGAEAAAGWFTIIGSCLLQGVDPAIYLYDVFKRLPDHPSKWVHELTPLNWRLAIEAGDIELVSPGRFRLSSDWSDWIRSGAVRLRLLDGELVPPYLGATNKVNTRFVEARS